MRARDLCVYFVLTAGALGVGCGGCLFDDEGLPATEVEPCIGAECPDAGQPGNNGFDRDVGGDVRNICEGQSCECLVGPEGGFCLTDFCGVVIEPGTLTENEVVRIREVAAPQSVSNDLLGDRVCELAPLESKPSGPLEMSIRYDESDIPVGFSEKEIMGVHVTPRYTLASDSVLDQPRDRVSFSVVRGGVSIGATVVPGEERVDAIVGSPRFNVDDASTYILNLSRYNFGAAVHDGQRFYVANGPRVFIWNNGVPEDPTTPPDVILGRPSLEEEFMLPSASAFSGTARAIWTDGEKLLVAEGHRVLIWSAIPDVDFAPADLVLGQDSFSDFFSNSGNREPSASGFYSPSGIWSDGDRLVVADTQNHRFLVWNEFPRVIGQPADLVIGQPDFDTAVPGDGEINAYQAWDAYFDGSRLALASRFACECFHVIEGFPTEGNPAADYTVGLGYPLNRTDPTTFSGGSAISKYGSNGVVFLNGARASAWFDFPGSSGPADVTLGKPDATIGGVLGNVTGSSFASTTPFGDVWSNEEYLFVGDGHRLLIWKGLPETNFAAPDMVIGQPGFGTEIAEIDYRGIGRKRVARPSSVSSAGDVTVIADRENSRVLILRGEVPFVAETVTVLGQRDGEHYFPNRLGAVTASTMRNPTSVYTDGTRIAVADSGNHRVLIWNSIPESDSVPADIVLGQADFASGEQNGGNGDLDGDGDFDADASTLHFPAGIYFDNSMLLVADEFNHRVLAWDGFPRANGEAADNVLGQPDFSANNPNRGLGWYSRAGDTLARPMDVDLTENGQILVSDSQNNRVLVFDGLGAGVSASAVIGQPDFTSDVSPEYYGGVNVGIPRPDNTKTATANTLRTPSELMWTGDSLLVADRGNHRVLEFPSLTTNVAATGVWGQPDFVTRAKNENTVSADSLNAPQGVTVGPSGQVIIADSGNNRLLRFNGEREANGLFGQVLYHENGINGASPALDTVRAPAGVALEPGSDRVWVADKANNRVVLFDGRAQRLVLGQEDLGGSAVNAGLGRAAAWTFRAPTDIWTDGVRLVVADRNNHRVLIWNELPEQATSPADVVVGQLDFSSTERNAGVMERAGRNTLFAPEGVYVDSTGALYVADTGNNRILIWDSIPTEHGASADRVLCQEDFYGNLPNFGNGRASAQSCAGPTDVVMTSSGLWVADSRNNRVLRFPVDARSGAAAGIALGQPDLTSRQPQTGGDYPSRANLANPVRVEFDGRNLYVVDRGNNRVLIWNGLPTQTYMPSDRVLGQETFDTQAAAANTEGLNSPFGIAVRAQDYNSAKVWVSDSGRNRVVVYDHVARPF